MADVQLEKGFVRVANRLDEAINCADFTLAQMKTVRAIIRLTWGWRQSSVRIAVGDIAERCGMKDSGGFRRDVRELVANGVLIEVEPAHGRTPSVWKLNKDFEAWGKFSISQAKLRALFSERPLSLNRVTPLSQPNVSDSSDRKVTPRSQETDEESLLDKVTPPSHPNDESEKPLPDSMESGSRLHGVTLEARKSLFGETCEPRKDRKDTLVKESLSASGIARTRAHTHAREADADQEQRASERYLESLPPASRADWRAEIADVASKHGIAVAERVCRDCLMLTTPLTPRAFRIFASSAADDEAKGRAKGSAPARAAEDDANVRAREGDALWAEYDTERAQAGLRAKAEGIDWSSLIDDAEDEIGPVAAQMPVAVEKLAYAKAAARIGFPDFDAWLARKKGVE